MPGTPGAVPGGIEAETRQMLDNVGALLHAVGLDYGDVVKATVYLRDFAEFAAMNAVYRDVLPDGAAHAGDRRRDRPGRGLPGRDRGDRRALSSRRRSPARSAPDQELVDRHHRVALRRRRPG